MGGILVDTLDELHKVAYLVQLKIRAILTYELIDPDDTPTVRSRMMMQTTQVQENHLPVIEWLLDNKPIVSEYYSISDTGVLTTKVVVADKYLHIFRDGEKVRFT